jgi:hypothetical protein
VGEKKFPADHDFLLFHKKNPAGQISRQISG